MLSLLLVLATAGSAQAQDDCDEATVRAAIEALPPDSLVSRHRFPQQRAATLETRDALSYGAVVTADCSAAVVVSRWSVTRRVRVPTRDLQGNPLVPPGGSIPMGAGVSTTPETAIDVWALRRGRARRVASGIVPTGQAPRSVAARIHEANGAPPAEICFGDRCVGVRGRAVRPVVVARAAGDDSVAATVGSGEWLDASHALGPQAELRAGGTVAAITRNGPEQQVRLISGETFTLRVPSGRLPFRDGDALEVRIRQRSIRIHRVVDATIRRGDGTLLLAMSGDGDATFAPGFTVERGRVATRQTGSAGMAERRDHAIVVRHTASGRTAIVPPNEWRRLVTPDGTFLITGHAVSYGRGNLVPDSSEYTTYSMIRVP